MVKCVPVNGRVPFDWKLKQSFLEYVYIQENVRAMPVDGWILCNLACVCIGDQSYTDPWTNVFNQLCDEQWVEMHETQLLVASFSLWHFSIKFRLLVFRSKSSSPTNDSKVVLWNAYGGGISVEYWTEWKENTLQSLFQISIQNKMNQNDIWLDRKKLSKRFAGQSFLSTNLVSSETRFTAFHL